MIDLIMVMIIFLCVIIIYFSVTEKKKNKNNIIFEEKIEYYIFPVFLQSLEFLVTGNFTLPKRFDTLKVSPLVMEPAQNKKLSSKKSEIVEVQRILLN